MVRAYARRIEYGSGGGRRHQVIMMYYMHDVSVAPVTLQGEPGSARARGMFGQNRSCDESHALLVHKRSMWNAVAQTCRISYMSIIVWRLTTAIVKAYSCMRLIGRVHEHVRDPMV